MNFSEQMPKAEVPVSQVNDETRDKKISREYQTEKILSFLERVGADGVLENKESRLEFIRQLDLDDLKSWLIRLNGISRDISIKDRGLARSYQSIGDYMTFPLAEDKDELLSKLLFAIKAQDDIESIAQILTIGINFIHPFADGNGRTGRLSYKLIADGYKKDAEDKEEIIEFISDDGRCKVPDTSLLVEYAVIMQEKKIGLNRKPLLLDKESGLYKDENSQARKLWNSNADKLIFQDDISKTNRDFFKHLIGNNDSSGLGFLVLSNFLISRDKLDDYTKEFPRFKVIDGEKLVRTLTNDDIENIRKIYSEIVSERLDIIIDMMTDAEKYKITGEMEWENSDATGMTIKEYVTKRVLHN